MDVVVVDVIVDDPSAGVGVNPISNPARSNPNEAPSIGVSNTGGKLYMLLACCDWGAVTAETGVDTEDEDEFEFESLAADLGGGGGVW